MPRTVKVVITPDIDENERDQTVDSLVQHFKQYYCHTREESLRNLAVTLEDQAFRHAETRDQYSYNLASLSSREVDKATQLQADINATVDPDAADFGSGTRPPFFTQHTIDVGIAQREANPGFGESSREWDNLNDGLSGEDKKARQQRARRKIMTRRRMRAQTASKTEFIQPQAPLPAVEKPLELDAESEVELAPYFSTESDKRGVKRYQPSELDEEVGVAEWIDEFCHGKGDASTLGSSFLEELPDGTFELDEECNDIETCFSSSESEVYARKRRRTVEESTD